MSSEIIQLFLNSNDRISGTPSNCIYSLPQISIPKNAEINVSIQTAEIPSSFYTIDDINNTLIYQINNGVITTLEIIEGNYNITDLIIYLHAQTDLTFVYNNKTNRITVSHASNLDFIIYNTSTCQELIGFSTKLNHISSSGSLISDSCVNLFPIKTLNVISNNFITNNITSNDTNNASMLLSIPNNSPAYSIIYYSNQFNTSTKVESIDNFTNLHIKLCDQQNRVIDLNGLNWSLTMQLNIVLTEQKLENE